MLETILCSLFVMLVFHHSFGALRHLHDSSAKAVARGSLLQLMMKKTIFALILGVFSVVISVAFLTGLYDIFSSEQIKISFFWIIFIVIILFLSITTKLQDTLIANQINIKLEPFITSSFQAFLFALVFAIIMSIVSYNFLEVQTDLSIGDYLESNKPSENNTNLIYLVEYIQVFKTGFINYISQYLDFNVVRYFFAFLTFFQALFIFYYVSILSSSLKKLIKSRESFEIYLFLLVPISLSIIIFFITPDVKSQIDKSTSAVKTQENQSKKVENDLYVLQNKYNDLEVKFEKLKNAKVSFHAKCIIFDCTVKDVISEE